MTFGEEVYCSGCNVQFDEANPSEGHECVQKRTCAGLWLYCHK